jgi:hypothetical protein
MNMASADNGRTWAVTQEDRATALEVVLLKRTYVLPWSQFLYAEGGADEVHLVFATHDVVVKGTGLESLSGELAAQRVAMIRELSRPDRFAAAGGRCIREIVVQKVNSEDGN